MIKKLIQHGNSAALIIDKPIMELLHLDMETPLEIATDGMNLIISPIQGRSGKEKLAKSLKKINQRHHRTLQRLAK